MAPVLRGLLGLAGAGLCRAHPAAGWGARCRQHRGRSLAWSEHVAAGAAARPGRVPGPGTEVSGACDAVMPSLLGAGGERERCGSGARLWWCHPPQPLTRYPAPPGAPASAAHGITITAARGAGVALGELGPFEGGAGGRSLKLQEVGLLSGWSLCHVVGGA